MLGSLWKPKRRDRSCLFCYPAWNSLPTWESPSLCGGWWNAELGLPLKKLLAPREWAGDLGSANGMRTPEAFNFDGVVRRRHPTTWEILHDGCSEVRFLLVAMIPKAVSQAPSSCWGQGVPDWASSLPSCPVQAWFSWLPKSVLRLATKNLAHAMAEDCFLAKNFAEYYFLKKVYSNLSHSDSRHGWEVVTEPIQYDVVFTEEERGVRTKTGRSKDEMKPVKMPHEINLNISV